MSTIAAQSAPLVLPALFRNGAFGFDYFDSEDDLSAVEVDFYLTRDDGDGEDTPRVVLTEASSGVVRTADAVAFDQTPAWVNTNLPAGSWEWHLLLDRYEVKWGMLQVLAPRGGDYTPS